MVGDYRQSHDEYLRAQAWVSGGVEESTLFGTPGRYPIYIERAQGQYLWDIDGNRLTDYLCGFGPIILGHAHPRINKVVSDALEQGQLFGLCSPVQNELARLLQSLIPCAERIRFYTTGSEGCAAAIRVARAATDREIILSSGYHGWLFEQDLKSGGEGIPASLKGLTRDFGYDPDKAESLFRDFGKEIACVFIEPDVRLHDGKLLEGLNKLCRRYGSLLVYDELKTGLRLSLGGAQEWFGVVPDLAVFGKAMANGYPISCLAGKRHVMDVLNQIWIAGTFHCEVSAMHASIATIEELRKAETQERLTQLGQELVDRIEEWICRSGIPARVVGTPRLPYLLFDESGYDHRFYEALGRLGHLMHVERWYLTAAHTVEDIAETVKAMEEAWEEAKAESLQARALRHLILSLPCIDKA